MTGNHPVRYRFLPDEIRLPVSAFAGCSIGIRRMFSRNRPATNDFLKPETRPTASFYKAITNVIL